jgi:16S rRNA C1402 (ribose-2'-O) methylase RsmI
VLETLARTLPTREVTLCIDLTLPQESILQGRPDTLRRRVKRIPLGAKVTLLLEGRKARKAGTKPVGLFQQPVSRRGGG